MQMYAMYRDLNPPPNATENLEVVIGSLGFFIFYSFI